MVKEIEIERIKTYLQEGPYTPTELASILGVHHFTIERKLQSLIATNPDFKVKTIGRYKVYWYRPTAYKELVKYVRETAPITEREQLLVTLYEKGATNKEGAIPAKAFSNKQREILDQLAIEQRIVITTEGRVLLTELGLMIAKGIKLTKK